MHFGGTHVRFNKTQYKQKGFTPILILVGVVVMVAAVGGVYYFGKFQVPKPQTPQLIAIPSSTPSTSLVPNGTEETANPATGGANWKIYTNKVFKYSLQYPTDWETYAYGRTPENDTIDSISERFFKPISDNSAEISLEVNQGESGSVKTLADVIKQYSWENKKIETIQVNGIEATKVSGYDQNHKNVTVVFGKDNYVYKIQTLGNYASVLDQILSTFKFLP